jgi:Holliday junction resolvase RusA-like endonuclease
VDELRELSLTIFTTPVAKARARTVVNNGKVHSFTPSATVVAEEAIRWEIVQHYESPPFAPKVPLSLTCVFYRIRPKGVSKKVIYPTGKPDTDNYVKLLLDAGNGYLWVDDSQIIHIDASKLYGNPPRIELKLTPVQGP